MLLLGRRSHRSDQLVKIIALGGVANQRQYAVMNGQYSTYYSEQELCLHFFGFSLQNAITFVVDAIDKSSASC